MLAACKFHGRLATQVFVFFLEVRYKLVICYSIASHKCVYNLPLKCSSDGRKTERKFAQLPPETESFVIFIANVTEMLKRTMKHDQAQAINTACNE